jgi:DNA invertase Pin-like site-specific DNA recombinase
MKVAIYARYSSDNQRDASIADQLRICREFAARQGWTVVQEFTDHGWRSRERRSCAPDSRR